MEITIKHRFNGNILYKGDHDNIKIAIISALKDGADLQGAYLQGAYLQCADLQCADLQGADLRGADLRGADLQCADLHGAYLQCADLRGAYLQCADLRGADLRDADLRDAYLRDAYLRDADLRGADLRGADLQGADLQGAYLQGAAINWQSHYLVAEILLREAGDDVNKRKIAGLILISTDWCWEKFIDIKDPLNKWALEVLSSWVKDGDNAPDLLHKLSKQKDDHKESEATP